MTRWRGYFATDAGMVGAPTTTPSAYSEMSQPACAMAASGSAAVRSGSRSAEIWGSRPMTTNSVMPMPKDPMARERSVHVAGPLEGVEEVTASC